MLGVKYTQARRKGTTHVFYVLLLWGLGHAHPPLGSAIGRSRQRGQF